MLQRWSDYVERLLRQFVNNFSASIRTKTDVAEWSSDFRRCTVSTSAFTYPWSLVVHTHDLDAHSMASASLTETCKQYLSVEEADQIHQQVQSESFLANKQVMWSGMQKITTAMGPLKMLGHPSCLRSQKNGRQWSNYNKCASALFTYYVARGELVTVLSPPPPDRFHTSGGTNYQSIEKPLLKRFGGDVAVGRIDMIHPIVALAKDFRYQIWPFDVTSHWMDKFQDAIIPLQCWRKVKSESSPNSHSPLCDVGRGAEASECHTAD